MPGDDRRSDRYPPTMGDLARLILEAQAAGEPITLSINGRGKLPVADPRSAQQLYELVEQLEAVEALRQGLHALEGGQPTHGLEAVFREARAKHGIPL